MEIFGTDIDLNRNEAKNFRAENLLSFPTAGVADAGLIIFHTGQKSFYGWDGTDWKKLNT